MTPLKKQRFAALAASRAMTESRLLTLLVDTVLEHNPVVNDACSRSARAIMGELDLRASPCVPI